MTARLRPVPDTPPRALGLIRVSKLGERSRDDLVSPEIQRAAITDHCARRGYSLDRWVEGIDESGSQRRSKWWARLDECVSLVESGDADVLVVWKFSRVARARLRWAVAVDRVEVAGGLIESATEPLDVSTSSGRLARGVLKEFDAYLSEQIGGTWREVHARRTARGLPANGKPRYGYTYVDGLHRPDPDTGPVLAALYRRYVTGESVYALVRWLNAEGWRTAAGYSRAGPGPWSDRSLRRVLDSGFAAGLLTVRGEPVRGVHEPLIDPKLWDAYQAARADRRVHRSTERSHYLLSGLVRCACGSAMTAGQFGHARAPKYRCTAAREQGRHPGGYVMAGYVERAVTEWLAELAADVEQAADAALAQQARARRRRGEAERLAREIAALGRELVTLTRQLAAERVPEAAYAQARDEILAQQAALEQRRRQAEADAGAPVDVATVARDLLARWPELPIPARRGGLRGLIRRVTVTPGRPRATIDVVPVWRG